MVNLNRLRFMNIRVCSVVYSDAMTFSHCLDSCDDFSRVVVLGSCLGTFLVAVDVEGLSCIAFV